MKADRVFKDFRNDNLVAIIFHPVKYIAINKCIEEDEQAKLLKELIGIIQNALIL